MQEKVISYFRDLYNKWLDLERSQRLRIMIITAVLAVTLGLTIYLVVKPKTVVLSRGLDNVAISQISAALTDAGIKSKMINNTTAIQVNEADADRARILLSEKDIPKMSGTNTFTYQDALSFSGMGTTESVKVENFVMVKSGQIATNLKQFDGVENATVTLAIPKVGNYFLKDEGEASASVTLTLNKEMDKAQAAAVARFVARSVEGLKPEKVEIIDTATMKTIYSGSQLLETGQASTEYELQQIIKAQIEAQIKATFAPLYNEVRPTVNVKINWDKSQQKSTLYETPIADSDKGIIDRQITSDKNVTNGETSAEPGTNANDQATTNYATGNGTSGTASEKEKETSYKINQIENATEKSSGDIIYDQSSVSVVLYQYKKYDQNTMAPTDFTNGQTWEQFKDAHEFDKTVVDLPEGLLKALQTGTGIDNADIICYQVPVFYDKVVTPIKVEQIAMFAILAILILMLAYGLIKSAQKEEITEIEPELSVEDLLVSTQMEEQKEAESIKLAEIGYGQESEVKHQIEKFVTERPEAVAQLLRNWLNEDWE